MRSFAVCAILLSVAAVAPPPFARSAYEPLWALGLLILLAVTAQNVAGRLRLPALSCWVAAGLFLGPTLLAATDLTRVPVLRLTFSFAGLWAGLLVGLAVPWPVPGGGWRLPAVVAGSTAIAFTAVALGIALVTDLPWPLVAAIAAVASLWGPVVSDFWRNRDAQRIGLFGTAVALALLSLCLLVGSGAAGLPEAGADAWVARLWLAVGGGALAAETLRRLRHSAPPQTILFGLLGLTMVAALVADHFALPSLPLGLGAGLALTAREGSHDQLGSLLAPARSLAVLLFAALLVSSFDAAAMLWPPTPGLYEIVLVQAVVLALVRGLGPALWYPVPRDDESCRRTGWLLLPKGLLGAELVLGTAGLASLWPAAHADLLRRVVVADLFLYGVAFATLASLLPRRPARAAAPSPSAPRSAAAT